MANPTYKTQDVVAALSLAIDHNTERQPKLSIPDLLKGLLKQFPGISKEQLERACFIEADEKGQDAIDAAQDYEQHRLLGTLFDGLRETITFGEAVEIKAASGNEIALWAQKQINSPEYRVGSALLLAAEAAHPLCKMNDDAQGRVSWIGDGDMPTESAMIDWFQMHYPTEAREIEARLKKA